MNQLIVDAYAGLCNRLRVLISAQYLAEKFRRQLVLCWRTTDDCGARFGDLFTNSIIETDTLRTPPLPKSDCTPECIARAARSADPAVCISECHWLITDADQRKTIPYFQALRPVDAVTDAVATIAGQFRGRTVGVHVRRGDFAEHIFRHYQTGLPQLEQYFAFLKGWDTIFLSTDGGDAVIEPFRDRFGERLVVQPQQDHARSTPQAIQAALVDLYLLQSCQAVVGTRYSTFSEFAWFITGVPRAKVSVREPSLFARLKFSSRVMFRRIRQAQ